jgi:hypothetical protein
MPLDPLAIADQDDDRVAAVNELLQVDVSQVSCPLRASGWHTQ